MHSDPVRLRAQISGRVQGVGFRFFVVEEAVARGLAGYAMNLPTGDVEVVAEGERGAIEDFLAQLRVGPRAGRVDEVVVMWDEARGDTERFEIRY